ncbi:MAG TPA: protein phosphatase 2C domain-containing protein [Bryobacteraceae bacterium]|nr:protein phosphatase 2C domain-containing protein [Bryobacteraceae bacterium]
MKTAAMWRAGVASDPGLERDNNEDRVFVDEAAGIFLVVDGVGGQAAGEKAADVAVEVISDYLARSGGEPEQCVRASITAANNEIYRLSQLNEAWRGMACVLTLALAREDRVTVGHVGDSRLYLAWDGKLRKLTSDHSPIGEREDQGELTEFEAMRHPRRNQVFRDVGSKAREASDEDFIEVRSFPLHPDAALLLCSDGLSDTVPSSEISAIVESYDGDPETVSMRLIDAANRAGGKDNISVVFVAGPEFTRSRARHAITRVRRHSRWRIFLSRALWMAIGVVAGIALWNALPRFLPGRATWNRATWNRANWNRANLNRTNLNRTEASILVSAGDPQAIAKAMNSAHSGDTIEVAPGEFFGPIEFKDGVNLISEKPGATIVRADPAAVADAGIAIAARGVHKGRISGFRILGDEKSALATGLLLDHSAIEVDDAEITGAANCGVRIEGSPAGSLQSVLRANFIHDNAGCGVWIGGESAPRLAGNRISQNGAASSLGDARPGVEVHPPAAPSIDNNMITGNGAPDFGPVPAPVADDFRRRNVME